MGMAKWIKVEAAPEWSLLPPLAPSLLPLRHVA